MATVHRIRHWLVATELIFSQLHYAEPVAGATTNMTLAFEMSAPMAVGHSLVLRLVGFNLIDSQADDSFAETVWREEHDELRLTLLQPLQANIQYAITLHDVVLPIAGLPANSSACQIASENILLPWTEIEHTPAVTGNIAAALCDMECSRTDPF